MTSVYAAAIATKLHESETPEQVWEELTQMFNLASRTDPNVMHLVYDGLTFDTKTCGTQERISVGDIFKATTNGARNTLNVEIIECEAPVQLSYVEWIGEDDRSRTNQQWRTDLQLTDKSNGTLAQITRRQKGDNTLPWNSFSNIMENVFGDTNFDDVAAARLERSINGTVTAANYEDRELRKVRNNWTVERRDDLKLDF